MKIDRIAILIIIALAFCSPVSMQAETNHRQPISKADSLVLQEIRKYADLSRQCFTTNPKKGLQFADSAMQLSKQIKSLKGELLAYNARGMSYWGQLDYVNALLAYRNALRIARELKDADAVILAQIQAGTCFTGLGSPARALEEYQSALKQAQKLNTHKLIKSCHFNISYCLIELDRSAEAIVYLDNLQPFVQDDAIPREQAAWRGYKIDALRKLGHYRAGKLQADSLLDLGKQSESPEMIASAFHYQAMLLADYQQFNEALRFADSAIRTIAPLRDHANTGFLAMLLKSKGELLMKKHEKSHSTATLSAAANALQLATDKASEINEWRILADGFHMLYRIASKLGDHETALQHFTRYIQYRDTLTNIAKEQALHRTELDHALEKGQDSLRIINMMQEKQLVQQKENSKLQIRQTIYGWIISVLLLVAITGVLLFRKRIQHIRMKHLLSMKENEAALKEAALQTQMNDLMLSGIKSQMNPHFLFNCLTSITLYIEEQNLEAATRYLSLFSQLIRYMLDAASNVNLLLARELEMLKLYLELESMRFKHKLTYTIETDSELDPELMHIPHMMVQPVVENAIWHGLLHKPEGGHIHIAFKHMDGSLLRVTVEDNGIGRQQSALLKSGKFTLRKSMGTKLLQDRIALMNRQSDGACSFITEDLADAQGNPRGTRVTLIISVA